MTRLRAATCLLALAGCLSGCTSLAPARVDGPPRDLVVLVHGMGRTPRSMAPLARRLSDDGFRVLSFGYPSVGTTLPGIGHRLAVATSRALASEPAPSVHFVGHSLGGIAVRWMLANERPARVGRVVLLAPPNQGARSADRFAPTVGWLLRPMRDLRTDSGSTVRRLPQDAGVPLLIVRGRRDGKVSAAEAHLGGADEAEVGGGHTYVMMRPSAMRLVEQFLAGEALSEP